MSDPAKRQVRARRRMPEATGLSMGGYGGTSDTALGSVSPRGGDRATQAAAAAPRARRPEPTGNMTGAEFGRAGATSSTSLGARFDATRGGLASVTARRRRR